MNFIFLRKGASEVLATVLFVVLTLVLVSAISVAMIPYVKEKTNDAKNCLDVSTSLSFVSHKFTCYESETQLVGFTIKSTSEKIEKIRVAFYDSNGVSTIYDLEDGPNPANLGRFGQGFPSSAGVFNIEIPKSGQQLNYVALGANIVEADISAIVDGEVCPVDDSIELSECSSGVDLDFTPPIQVVVNINRP